MQEIRGRRITVCGLGRFGGGTAAARWLVEQGATVLVTDQAPKEKLADSVAQLADLPIKFRLGGHRISDFTDADLVVTSPAVPPNSEFLSAAAKAGVPITTEILLFTERCPANVVAVTGTKGKSTTTALLGRMLAARFQTWVGGNIGKSLLADLPNIAADDWVVLELSSYMLHHLGTARWAPRVAVVTMLSTDHVEWHGSAEAYIDAKLNIVRYQKPTDIAVLNRADLAAAKFIDSTKSKVIDYGGDRPAIDLKLSGRHNQLNAQAALAAAGAIGISTSDAAAAVSEFPGLPHRLEIVYSADGIVWVNDSIATIPEAAAAALQSFPARKVIQIVGGSDKHLPMDSLVTALAEHAKAVLCIGQTGPAIGAGVRAAVRASNVTVYDCGDLTAAIRRARSIARNGDVVLLSSGCASYDQFEIFRSAGKCSRRWRENDSAAGMIRPPLRVAEDRGMICHDTTHRAGITTASRGNTTRSTTTRIGHFMTS